MPPDPPTPPPLEAAASEVSGTFRFSVRTLFRVTTVLALVCGLGTILPIGVSQIVIGLVWIVVSGWLVAGIVFGRGDARAFCIGAILVATSMWTGLGGRFAGGIQSYLRGIPMSWGESSFTDTQGLELWLIHLILAAVAVGNGYSCVLAKRWFDSHS